MRSNLNAWLMMLIPCMLMGALPLGANEVAAKDYEPWAHPDVIRAAYIIGLDAKQQPKFRAHVTQFLQGYGADVRKLLRGHNVTNLPRKISTKRRNRVREMDDAMARILTKDQLLSYQDYRDLLLAKMDEKAAARLGR
ncbi:MAG: hypothetical protein AAF541_16735 [Pseudomonadota bacterium]